MSWRCGVVVCVVAWRLEVWLREGWGRVIAESQAERTENERKQTCMRTEQETEALAYMTAQPSRLKLIITAAVQCHVASWISFPRARID